MSKVIVRKIALENYKKFQDKSLNLFPKTEICGKNREGKSTIQDAYFDVLTGKLADGTQPDKIRRKEDGKEIDRVDVVRELTLDIDGKETVVRKITSQKWRKPRGQIEEVFDGNITSYEIDGFPTKVKDYNDFINKIEDSETILMCSNPRYFLNTLKKSTAEARKLLEKMSGFDVAAFITEHPEYAATEEITRGHTVEDTLKKLNKEKLAQKKKVEAKRAEISYETGRESTEQNSNLEEKKNQILNEIAGYDKEIESLNEANKAYESLTHETIELSKSLNEIARVEAEKIQTVREEASLALNNFKSQKRLNEDGLRTTMNLLANVEKPEILQQRLERLRQQYKETAESEWDNSKLEAIQKERFDPETAICPTCGQDLPQEQVEQLQTEFEAKKQERIRVELKNEENFNWQKKMKLNEITEEGNSLVERQRTCKEDKTKLESDIEDIKSKISKNVLDIAKAEQRLKELPIEPDLSANAEYQAVKEKVQQKQKQLDSLENHSEAKAEIQRKKAEALKSLTNVESDIKAQEIVSKSKEKKLIELNAELKEMGQVLADIEHKIDTVLNFSIEKNKALAGVINPHFKHFQFEFLDYTIEGNPVEVCRMMVNGIDYMNGLNHSDRILCDIDLTAGLQELNHLNLPIWVDDAESVNSDRIPDTGRQMILLRVSECELEVKEC